MGERLKGKVAIVTGAASGIGLATAKLLAAEGARVTIADIDTANGEALAKQIGDALFVRTNVASENDIKACVAATVQRYGGLDCLVNGAAGPSPRGPIEETSVEEFKAGIDVLLIGQFIGIKHAIPEFKKRGGGAVVNIASLAGLFGISPGLCYNTAKHGVIGLARGSADQLARFNIRVNVVAPGWIITPPHEQFFTHVDPASRPDVMRRQYAKKQPIQRAGHPNDIAEAIVYLLSDNASFVTGQVLVVDGGLTAVTRAFDEIGVP